MLEYRSPIKRTRVARTILFLPARRGTSMGSIAVHRTESIESRGGFRSGGVALVERSWPLRDGTGPTDASLALEIWRSHWTPSAWREYLAAGESESGLALIRQRTHTGRPLGSAEFIHSMEKIAQRRLVPQKRGPREKIVADRRQGEFTFEP